MAAPPTGQDHNLTKRNSRSQGLPKLVLWLLIICALLIILGINHQEIKFILDLGNTICLSCIGVG